ncbi:hypothetical protein [Alsobacter metallidurans]|nr:hypothetical protein [Alsobacter metallidurans]
MPIENKSPDELSLDRANPRFGLAHADTEAEALEILAETANLKELWDSIAERGYESFEPLVAMNEGGRLVVLEGNRRLAAVKLLLNPELLNKEAARRRIPRLPADKLATCQQLSVITVGSRDDAAGYIGFKHVNGPARWSSLAKAKFGVDFYESMSQQQSPHERMKSLTKQLGDSRGLIIRLLVAYKIVLQCSQLGIFEKLDIEEGNIEFSHLYTLINNPDSRAFIGLSRAPLSESMFRDNPVPDTHHAELALLMSWLYGERSVIKAQGTDRPRLQRVLASDAGLKELKVTGDLGSAEAVAGLKNDDWLEMLAKAATILTKATTDAAVVSVELTEESTDQARSLIKRIELQTRQIKSVLITE